MNVERISGHIRGNAEKLRGVIYDVPLTMKMDEIMQEVNGGNVVKICEIQLVLHIVLQIT